MDGAREFLQSSTIHGLVYIGSELRPVRLFWICVVIAGFTGSFILINQSFSVWAVSPISTTIETMPITDIDFPNVTVCPPRNSFTSLNPDLLRSRSIDLDQERRKLLSNFALDVFYDFNFNSKYLEFIAYKGEEKYSDWYEGTSNISFPYKVGQVKRYDLRTTAASGSFSTPYFGQPFDDKTFDGKFESEIYIYGPDNLNESISLVIAIDYDISFGENILLQEAELEVENVVGGSHKKEYYKTIGNITLDRNKRHDQRKYLINVETSLSNKKVFKPKRIFLKYSRDTTAEFYSGGGRPVAGMKVSWFYSSPEKISPNSRYLEDNKHFLMVSNIIHQEGATTSLEDLVSNIISLKKQKARCTTGLDNEDLFLEKYGNVSEEPIYKNNITEESLEIAAKIYFQIVFCHDYDLASLNFYQNLFENFPLETVLKTLARILLVAKEKNLSEHYEIAKALFDRTTTTMNLQYRDIAVMTTETAELDLFPDLKNLQPNPDMIQGLLEIEKLISQPPHISPSSGLSSFIPFCSFGGFTDSSGVKNSGDFPVCGLFTERTVKEQVCYEADLNQFKELLDRGDWEDAMQDGLSMVIDTNDEYDVKNILEKQSLVRKDQTEIFPIYKQSKNLNSFRMMLNTISKSYNNYNCDKVDIICHRGRAS